MARWQEISAKRFGYGAGPGADAGPADMLARLAGPDPIPGAPLGRRSEEGHALLEALREVRRQVRNGEGGEAARARQAEAASRTHELYTAQAQQSLARILGGPDPLRERLVWFWADHFSVAAGGRTARTLAPGFIEDAIRPNVTGRFGDLLIAATLHPAMLHYLDQRSSVGPGSPRGRRTGRGLNENHARELLELHTVGVGGGYTQTDVRQLAEAMTGLGTGPGLRPAFKPGWAEPGAETVLGRTYDGPQDDTGQVRQLLSDLALHPDTARHIARKLAVHFVSDDPSDPLVRALEEAWSASGGDLMAVYGVLLEHPAARAGAFTKVRPPFEWTATALRALGVRGETVVGLDPRAARRLLLGPLAQMGQPFMIPPGPDGWAEVADRWIRPQVLAARIAWALRAPASARDMLPDPRVFANAAIPWGPPEETAFAAAAAERRRDGIALVLLSPDLMRR